MCCRFKLKNSNKCNINMFQYIIYIFWRCDFTQNFYYIWYILIKYFYKVVWTNVFLKTCMLFSTWTKSHLYYDLVLVSNTTHNFNVFFLFLNQNVNLCNFKITIWMPLSKVYIFFSVFTWINYNFQKVIKNYYFYILLYCVLFRVNRSKDKKL